MKISQLDILEKILRQGTDVYLIKNLFIGQFESDSTKAIEDSQVQKIFADGLFGFAFDGFYVINEIYQKRGGIRSIHGHLLIYLFFVAK
jgi:hypothetical protein